MRQTVNVKVRFLSKLFTVVLNNGLNLCQILLITFIITLP